MLRASINKSIILILSVSVFTACSSTKRFTSEEGVSNTRNIENVSNAAEIGEASFYADDFNGKKTANGEIYNMDDLTAAHPSLPFNSIVKVTNLANNKSVKVRINDRMPSFKGRIIDLSLAAAKKIDMINSGVQKVKLEVLSLGEN